MKTKLSIFLGLGFGVLAGAAHSENSPRLLQEDLATALVRQTLAAVITAHDTDNFSVLHSMGSVEFSEKIPVNQLALTIGELLGEDVSLLPALLPEPEFAEPLSITDDNQIAVIGFIPTAPLQTNFAFNYVWEAARWRISNLSFSLTPAVAEVVADPAPSRPPSTPARFSDWDRRGIPRPSVRW